MKISESKEEELKTDFDYSLEEFKKMWTQNLISMIINQDYEEVEELFKDFINIDFKYVQRISPHQNTLLMIAMQHFDERFVVEMIDVLKNTNYDFNTYNESYITDLLCCITQQKYIVAEKLIKDDLCNLLRRDNNNETVLNYVLLSDDFKDRKKNIIYSSVLDLLIEKLDIGIIELIYELNNVDDLIKTELINEIIAKKNKQKNIDKKTIKIDFNILNTNKLNLIVFYGFLLVLWQFSCGDAFENYNICVKLHFSIIITLTFITNDVINYRRSNFNDKYGDIIIECLWCIHCITLSSILLFNLAEEKTLFFIIVAVVSICLYHIFYIL